MAGLLAYCRPGFEADLAKELGDKSAALGRYGFARTESGSGFVYFECYQAEDAQALYAALPLSQLIFARQLFVLISHLSDLDAADRIGPILDACSDMPRCGDLRVEYPDTTEGRELSKFCRKFSVPLRQALRKKGQLTPKEDNRKPVLFAFFTRSDRVYLGYAERNQCSPFELGIMRLKTPAEAPSRSSLKLDEAIQLFLSPKEQEARMQAGMQAVDLGACPGGWTYQLVRRGLFVQAVDNGAMADSLMETGQVRHFAEDGFKFRPKKKNVHWLVCDMVEQPTRVAKLMSQWLLEGLCKEAIFNLKLPMKRRYESVQEALAVIDEMLSPKAYLLQAKHLYHDREEITLHLRLL
ncbi:23S rRNA (cytidine(2498)-2'-O)-methyltransferase RlmM [Aliiglaciecola sp. CAU 1673]|uniref:23S rRNA (cytidine(2498)-2'-O)-methyltransferase RlmM n=1 Tax=Aliiglaciecola sp. CAU 1673 TaxID=3032595 RepID=UPI0023D98405|nr:23S rRNA (cytidine(2498)-2'-O)-methyltransferase RlmM [Aliiglaciecola sp. CAU 1673]MDF2179401.1 23S rRNA (cytidine(2498)-2'-O)-methyltransferase RlmM [Aliiglaciecola sp. CAU 1673]